MADLDIELKNFATRLEELEKREQSTANLVREIQNTVDKMEAVLDRSSINLAANAKRLDFEMPETILIESGDGYEVIADRCAQAAASATAMDITNSVQYYYDTIDALASLRETQIVPVANIGRKNTAGKRQIALRHDVDADVVTAVDCARYLQKHNLPGSFYILHTSHYYGAFSTLAGRPCFTRHSGFKQFLHDLFETNIEIGIHNDALGVVFDHAANGVAAFVNELQWMREQGVKITGSAAHNSPAVYGAECFEIFNGLSVGDRRVLHWRGKTIPLQTISMNELELEYEANHPIPRRSLDLKSMHNISKGSGDLLRQEKWQKQYFLNHPVFERGYEYDAWLIGNDTWLLAGNDKVLYPLTLGKLSEQLENLPAESRIVISIHPVYVGKNR